MDEAQKPLRVMSSDILEGRFNIALGQALIDSHKSGASGDTLRFLRFKPTALVGRHQDLSREINLEQCQKNGVGLARRITGGGAIYLDEGQLGWELVIHKKSLGTANLTEVAAKICTAAAKGLSRLGLDVRYRPRNDLEVDGKKISGTGGFFDGDTLFFQGTVLVDMDPQKMMAALNVPVAKLQKRGQTSIADRVTSLKALMGDKTPSIKEIEAALLSGLVDSFNMTPFYSDFTEAEKQSADQAFNQEIGLDDFVAEIDNKNLLKGVFTGTYQSSGGTISAHLRVDGQKNNRIREIIFTGDFFITPPRILLDLESKLRGVWLAEVEPVTLEFFERAKVDMMSASPQDFIAAIKAAIDALEGGK